MNSYLKRMGSMASVLKETGTTYPSRAPMSPPSPQGFGGVRVAHLVSFLCCVVLQCFVCLRLVSCVSNATSVSGLSISDCPFDIYFTEYGTALTTVLPILFLYLKTVIVTAGTFEL